MFKTRLIETISSPKSPLKQLIRTALLSCLVGTVNQGCIRAYPYGGAMYAPGYYPPSAYYYGMRQPCVPPLPTVIAPATRPYYFARPLGPTTVIVAPSHDHYLCP